MFAAFGIDVLPSTSHESQEYVSHSHRVHSEMITSQRPRDYPPTMTAPTVTLKKRNSLQAVAGPNMAYRNSIGMPEIRDAKSLQDVSAHSGTEIVHMNVGGKRYSTLYETLASCKSSFFQHFIRIDQTSGKILLYHKNFLEDGQNAIFVNRDGDLFAYILQYMRDGKHMVLPEDAYLLRQVLREADFFGLEGLRRIIGDVLRFEEKRTDDRDETLTSIKNAVSQIQQNLYYNGFKR